MPPKPRHLKHHLPLPKRVPTFGAIPLISVTEVEEAINRMEPGEVTESNDITAEF